MQTKNWVQPETVERVQLVADAEADSPSTAPQPAPDLIVPSESESEFATDPADASATDTQNPSPFSTSANVAPEHGPKQFGSYELHWEIRKDALSTTWAAKREGVDRTLALRIFNERFTDSTQVRNIQKAARKAAELTHLNHVTVYEDGVSLNGAPYIVTDWVEGDTLTETFQVSKRLDITRFLNIFNQVCEALIEAHSHLLVHGNLSPNKIILVHQDDADSEIVKLIDFGMPADPVQNAFYLSPEQCLDRNKCDERTDIYSLGCIMYESLVGSPPFIGDRVSQASANYLHEMANQYSKDAPEHNALKLLDCIIIKCLQKKPSTRFGNVRELMDALRLVSDCICQGSKRKLPRKAEKLLLFRFLEFFDRKIVIGVCAYLILGMVSLKYLGELQLQKNIDEAQIFSEANLPLATADWKAALNQAQLSQKPPGLQADLHWELAEALKKQFLAAETSETRNKLADEARRHYQAAFEYYRRGSHYRWHSLALLENLSSMWLVKAKSDLPVQSSNAAQNEVKKLFDEKKFEKCALVAGKYFDKFSDNEIAFYAGSANQKIGSKLPAKKALRYFERAEYYFEKTGSSYPSLVQPCLLKQGYDPNAEATHLSRGCEAFADDDLEAAQYHFIHTMHLGNFWSAIESYRALKNNENEPGDSEQAIEPLEQYLKLQEEIYGQHEKVLAQTLLNLARCYQKSGASQKAIDAYKRAFAIIPNPEQSDSDVLNFVDLLAKQWHRQEARTELEKRIIVNSQVIASHPLLPRLIEAYASDKMRDKSISLIKSVCHVPEMAKYGYSYEECYGHPAHPDWAEPPSENNSTDGDPFAQSR